ncbi:MULTISPECIES: glycosyltransferase [unclassified Modestobacter]|uniref:glycosyltransferase n=1 Tax=unclassified Modestobacter TaxID=2643866 RepID=UPI0022AA7BC5|nr:MULTISPECIES: glycosyltransferase [unclassified Modestobacter]MCZ2823777.1 glycosyltransferase [Modestobacter sp. VKM Ac-2981]MCZ2852022.1 glycosyltransferase [Modestobacter sp. VKM Ac-2982]
MSTRVAPAISLSGRLNAASPRERATLLARLSTVVSTLSGSAPQRRSELIAAFEELLADADPSSVWLATSVLDGELTTPTTVTRTTRAIRLDGVAAAFGSTPVRTVRNWVLGQHWPEVRVVTDTVLVDLEHTARAGLATGIQRVARETTRRWARDHEVTLVAWSPDYRQLRPLEGAERTKALTGEGEVPAAGPPEVVLVPWRSTYLLPELSPERDRNERIAAIAQFARSRTGVIGFDCVPVTTAETTALGVGEAFAHNLAAVRHMDQVSTISEAAAVEYRGWRAMLASTGRTGPAITADLLPAEVPATTPEDLAAIHARHVVPGVPMVLCVGSHEPRKNHLALLHAAELLWREGVPFTLVLVGGRSWNDERFQQALEDARGRNRPVETVTTMTDRELWAAYRVARCTVFPSLNEGFGLPVAESLACGTPVITSGYGAMAEIAQDGGALLVDPRDDHSIAAALRTVLIDEAEHARLSEQARRRPASSWDDYAARTWTTLTAGPAPTS